MTDRYSLWMDGALYEEAPTIPNLWHKVRIYIGATSPKTERLLRSRGEVRDAGEETANA